MGFREGCFHLRCPSCSCRFLAPLAPRQDPSSFCSFQTSFSCGLGFGRGGALESAGEVWGGREERRVASEKVGEKEIEDEKGREPDRCMKTTKAVFLQQVMDEQKDVKIMQKSKSKIER